MSHHYSGELQGFVPAAPTLDTFILAKVIGKKSRTPIKMLLDSGADCCCLPESAIRKLEENLGLELPYGAIRVADFAGHRTWKRKYQLTIEVAALGDQEVELDFIAIDDNVGILSRRFLNHWPIVLDGPGLQWGVCNAKGCHRVSS